MGWCNGICRKGLLYQHFVAVDDVDAWGEACDGCLAAGDYLVGYQASVHVVDTHRGAVAASDDEAAAGVLDVEVLVGVNLADASDGAVARPLQVVGAGVATLKSIVVGVLCLACSALCVLVGGLEHNDLSWHVAGVECAHVVGRDGAVEVSTSGAGSEHGGIAGPCCDIVKSEAVGSQHASGAFAVGAGLGGELSTVALNILELEEVYLVLLHCAIHLLPEGGAVGSDGAAVVLAVDGEVAQVGSAQVDAVDVVVSILDAGEVSKATGVIGACRDAVQVVIVGAHIGNVAVEHEVAQAVAAIAGLATAGGGFLVVGLATVVAVGGKRLVVKRLLAVGAVEVLQCGVTAQVEAGHLVAGKVEPGEGGVACHVERPERVVINTQLLESGVVTHVDAACANVRHPQVLQCSVARNVDATKLRIGVSKQRLEASKRAQASEAGSLILGIGAH